MKIEEKLLALLLLLNLLCQTHLTKKKMENMVKASVSLSQRMLRT